MSPIIYSNKEVSRQISNIVFNIISLVIFIYFSKSLLSNPISCFLFYLIFYFIIIGFFISFSISNVFETPNEEQITEEIGIIESTNIIEKKEIKNNNKYKLFLKKIKNLRKEVRETKNEINDMKREIFVLKKNGTPIYHDLSDVEEETDNIIIDDNIRVEILDNIINQSENNFEIIQKD